MGLRELGKLIEARRNEARNPATGRSWTQGELARALDMKKESLGQIERGERKFFLEPAVIHALARLLGNVSVAELVRAGGYSIEWPEGLTPQETEFLAAYRECEKEERAYFLRLLKAMPAARGFLEGRSAAANAGQSQAE